jgi:peroxiredoxin
MLAAGDRVPQARVWTAAKKSSVALSDALGDGMVLLCFYLWDWSPT